MQILELYIRDGIGYKGAATSTSTNNLVDANADFTSTVKVGYIAFNQTDKTFAKITAITNSTTLALSDNIFTNLESYFIKSDFERLDLFDDESVTITDSLKNVKDIGKVFTPFSQQFNVPASKHNSKIFRHYEDFDIINSFDARYYKSYWAALDVPRHIWHYTIQGITSLVESKGFKLEKKYPLFFDVFYISYISETHKNSRFAMIRGFFFALLSNFSALFNKEFSSMIFIFKKSI